MCLFSRPILRVGPFVYSFIKERIEKSKNFGAKITHFFSSFISRVVLFILKVLKKSPFFITYFKVVLFISRVLNRSL